MKQTIKYLLVAFSTTVLVACGSGSDDSGPDTMVTVVPNDTGSADAGSTATPTETTDTEPTVTPTETTDTEPTATPTETTDAGSTETPTETTDTGPTDTPVETPTETTGNTTTIGIFGPPQILQSECGSVAVADDIEATNTAASPMTVNQLVQGQLLEGSSVLNFDLWQITLEPGNYHLIADMWEASLEKSTVGLEISSLVDTEEDRLAYDTFFGHDGRVNSFLTIENPTTLTLKLEPVYDEAMNYVMGIFANGATVPTPRFIDCPTATRIGLNEPQTLALPEEESADDARWFRMSLSAGVYFMDASMSSVEDETMGYGIDLIQNFGDDDTVSRISYDTEYGTSVSTSDSFSVLENADVWIRIINVYDDRNIEFTVYQ